MTTARTVQSHGRKVALNLTANPHGVPPLAPPLPQRGRGGGTAGHSKPAIPRVQVIPSRRMEGVVGGKREAVGREGRGEGEGEGEREAGSAGLATRSPPKPPVRVVEEDEDDVGLDSVPQGPPCGSHLHFLPGLPELGGPRGPCSGCQHQQPPAGQREREMGATGSPLVEH